MTANFVTFYLIILLITGPFFQYIPIPESLNWDEVLLAKILNQAPIVFLIGYLVSRLKRVQNLNIFALLIAFLTSFITSEIYYYFVHPDYLFTVGTINNIGSYLLLGAILIKKISSIKNTKRQIFLIAIGISVIIAICYSFTIFAIFKNFFSERPAISVIHFIFIIVSICIIYLSFLAENPYKRTWYETIIGVISIITIDIYVYTHIFVLNSEPKLLFTFGRIISSIGILLIVDGILRAKIKDKLFIQTSMSN